MLARITWATCAALLILAADARAQPYPARPITMVVPFPAGGPTDTIARVVAERMRVSLGQPLIIENVTGADGEHRCRARSPCYPGRLHAELRDMEHARRQRCRSRAILRCGQRLHARRARQR